VACFCCDSFFFLWQEAQENFTLRTHAEEMGFWGVNSDENDHTQDALIEIKVECKLYSNEDDLTPLDGQAKVDAHDSALMTDNVPWPKSDAYDTPSAFVGSVISLLKEGFRIPIDILKKTETGLRSEKVGEGWSQDRTHAIMEELKLIDAAKQHHNMLPQELCDANTSKGLMETLVSKVDPDGYQAFMQGFNEKKGVSAESPPPFAWLDSTSTKDISKGAKHLGINYSGMGRNEIVCEMKSHQNRWRLKRFAPY
jgi:hypothetical protein